MTKIQIDTQTEPGLQKIKEIIVREVDPELIILFGSRAKGKTHKDSDYDICVLKSGIEGNSRKIKHKLYIALFEVGEAIDLILSTPYKFEQFKNDKYLVYKNIYNEGKVIYEKFKQSA